MSNALQIKSHTSTSKPPASQRPLSANSSASIDPSRPLERIDAQKAGRGGYEEAEETGGPAHIRERIAADNRKAEEAFAKRWNLTAATPKKK